MPVEAELPQPTRSVWAPFVPLALLTCAVLVWTIFQTLQLYREWGNLQTLRTNQEAQVQASARLRTALDTLARDMAKLAEQGNPNARTVVDELRKRGITINPNAPPAK